MEPRQVARSLGIAIAILVAALTLLLNNYEVVKLSDSVTQLWFLALGALTAIALQLINYPSRLLGRRNGKVEEASTASGANVQVGDSRTFEKALLKQSDLEKVNRDLDAHRRERN